jgi:hypothetical protein
MTARRGRPLAVAAIAATAAICISAPGLARAATAPAKGIRQVACRP